MMRAGDLIFLRQDGETLTGYVTEAKKPGCANVAIHNAAGILLFGVADAPIATTDAERKIDGNIWIRS